MWVVEYLIEKFNWLSEYFYDAYLEILALPWPLWMAAWPFYMVSWTCAEIANHFWHMYSYFGWIEQELRKILNWPLIWSRIRIYVPNILEIRDWFYYWREWVNYQIGQWWSVAQGTVWDWMRMWGDWASAWFEWFDASLVDLRSSWNSFWLITWPEMLSDLGGLRTAWEDFLSGIVPDLATWTGVSDLVESAFRTWFPFYDNLASLWGGIQEFFVDPEEWLYKSFDRIIERYW